MLVRRPIPAIIDPEQANYITAEFSRVCQDPVDGIYVCPLSNNFLEWKGFIMVRAGCYSGGTFRFTMILPAGFPQSSQIPVILFDSFIFHPYINNNELCLSGCFPDGEWRRDKHKILDVLHYLQEVFAILTENFPLDHKPIVNKQAAMLFSKDFDNFQLRAEEIVLNSHHAVYDPPSDSTDPHVIVFSPYEKQKMEPIRRKLLGKSEHIDLGTNISSRTVSDVLSRTTSNGGEADDENVDNGSGESENSFEEIHLDNAEIRDISRAEESINEYSSIDLNSAPASARLDDEIPNEEEGDNGFDWVNDNTNILEQKSSSGFINDIKENNNASDDEYKPSIAFKIGCGSSSSGHEEDPSKVFDDSVHTKVVLKNTVSVEKIENVLESCVEEYDENPSSSLKNEKVRSVTVFNNDL